MTMQKLDFLLDESRKGRPMTLALACPYGDDAIGAIIGAKREGIVRAILIGDEGRIRTVAEQDGYDLSGIDIVDEKSDEKAVEKSVRMVSSGEADLLMKGLVKTSSLLKAVLDKEWGLRTGSLLSHLFLFEIPNLERRVIGISDGGMNTYPDLNAKAKIIENAVACYHKIGIPQPKIAALAAVEAVNPEMQATLDAAALAKMNERGQIKGCIVDGPLALDNAISEESAKIKGINSPVAGNADMLLVPDIESGNFIGKVLLYMTGGKGAGVILGARKPIVLTSRFDSMQTKLLSIALGAVVARS
ncbi:MAG: bifunctional enoyl-CoA hydratase/phosphate acetyltransferase [Synergistales bacterium]|jgi:phosphate butyryltransferase|uniref:bifunctional enoyl-CoA hydratase/phosphate acetyltransferase n=1 Tax=Aminivibrio sp. TaxID=1872489 RepID=UPI001D34E782|nr:bifunctional enoyl-CoA hydratase/phosphate acetyltransferase [Synergistaceae bacterium]MDD4021970.1 bifunctional enoyl-CoA hydratase/phosphate acetyltransferase [Synergistaceae bacterium]MDD4612738.1 bifunctional enoyl-CoA hydratase/phosphate acetyltransferase [Synergistaceae bacterium]NCC56007.1 bifunctional enoyl-CoA hydratase/phosphate acetyltransferase [Synergistales bacterium]